MKFKIEKKWLEKRAVDDDRAEVTVGGTSLDELARDANALRHTPFEQEQLASAFGWLIRSRRLEMRFAIDRLAKKARVDVSEIEEIENNAHFVPEPRVVYDLANALKLPAQKLMQLVGLVSPTSTAFTDNCVLFAARAKHVDELTEEQHDVLREFVKYLAEQP